MAQASLTIFENAGDPGATDDGAKKAYRAGSLWRNTQDNGLFICLDAAPDNAVWSELSQTLGGSPTFTNIDAGASGTAGSVDIFPATASKGKLAVTCTDQTGNTTVSLVAGAMAAARTITIPDPLAAANVMLGLQSSTARTATADGLTTGTIADAGYHQFITVTSADANHIIVLPTPTPGVVVILKNGGTGYELRSSAPATVAINGGSGASAESAIAANTMVIAVCTSATTWQAIGLAGTTLAAVEAAA